MEIQYLKKLIEYPAGRDAYGEISFENTPSSMEEILQLELTYNNGTPFPKVLRELLYLAGENCYCLEYNAVDPDFIEPTQTYMQESVRNYEIPNMGLNFTRPFYVIDSVYVGNFRFVYLDEGNDPIVHHIDTRDDSIQTFGQTLSQLIWHVIRHTHNLF
ncbi:hypothetical protein [Winogradskyella sp. SYSU M77433]|uniref:hypothetical protein n=1 Tax=Winogradskyella sp. SYSU M77433 TaxID=3042722 RepID=UPI0024816F8F|nr:hypothetical protein [Winogradskyella sp. SYSU M77433]MDH7911371.1 hypothetical protein [Winogradskyella sp. SYSU M77433]